MVRYGTSARAVPRFALQPSGPTWPRLDTAQGPDSNNTEGEEGIGAGMAGAAAADTEEEEGAGQSTPRGRTGVGRGCSNAG